MIKKPKWWDKPITWGTSVKMTLWSIPISMLWVLIMDLLSGRYLTDPICEACSDAKDWICDRFRK